MKNILVLSHHRQGGGKPLDSLWFSQSFLRERDINLHFSCTLDPVSSFFKIPKYHWILFDGLNSIRGHQGIHLFNWASLLRRNIALYWHETEWHIELPYRKNVVMKLLDNTSLTHFHNIGAGQNLLINKYGVNKDQIRVLPNITSAESMLAYDLPLPASKGLFVACGGVSERKGADLFLDIAEIVVKQMPDARFVWAGSFGDGEYSRDRIVTRTHERGLAARVTFVGRLDSIAELVSRADAFLVTSRDDPFPKTVMEALALGKHCVAFDVGGLRDGVGDCATIVPAEDVEKFSHALVNLDETTNSEVNQARRRNIYLERFTPEVFARNFHDVATWWFNRERKTEPRPRVR